MKFHALLVSWVFYSFAVILTSFYLEDIEGSFWVKLGDLAESIGALFLTCVVND